MTTSESNGASNGHSAVSARAAAISEAKAKANDKHFTLYVNPGPNPWKVLVVMSELGFTETDIHLSSVPNGENKQSPFIDLNPNGRLPALIDHQNNDFVIWESGAIILYLVEKYDTQKKISFEKFEDEAIAKQWLMFQMSGQGPYWGQAVWFLRFHPERFPSAVTRYVNEMKRTLGVLEIALSKQKYLVSDSKVSYADLSFMAWFGIIGFLGDELEEGFSKQWRVDFPSVARWYDELTSRESVKWVESVRQKPLASPSKQG